MEPKNFQIFKGQRATYYDRFIKEPFQSCSLFMQSVARILEQQWTAVVQLKIITAVCGIGNEAKLLAQCSQHQYIEVCESSVEKLAFTKTKLASYEKVSLIKGTKDAIEWKETYEDATFFLVLFCAIDNGAKLALIKKTSQRL
jgi:hypothetical protein